ncbi:hypothetical protein [Hahella sp. HN01]|uniref:hypothetical protein n=1 Tax=Hahella sp. HN01 TaxID=2847262 RepID=UPI001C1F000A|nr:hypothetical protein [Hahella sp. HN01]MBU6951606.1 hypothetical protein [Hahella sp. HN01]
MNEQQFECLREHLKRVLPEIEKFCSLKGFEFMDARALGRYPRIRVRQEGEIVRWIDLWMELDENGDRFEKFYETIPYELSAGAQVDIPDGTKYGHRYQKSFSIFKSKPFKDIPNIIFDEMLKADSVIAEWDKNYLIENGKKVILG